MERLITSKLIEWSKDKDSLPLFVLGARQVGKTYSTKQFAEKYYKDKYIYINFLDRNSNYEALKLTTNPEQIINTIRLLTNKNIDESWLLIFDEIQEATNIRSSLKHFVEQNYKYKIICLGSYLGNMLNDKESFPVGKIKTINMYPLNFEEFLMAKQKQPLIDMIKNSITNKKPLEEAIHKMLNDLLAEFVFIGGMPKVISDYLKNNDEIKANEIKQDLMNSYKVDVVKYIQSNSDKLKCQTIYENIPLFLSKENKKYKLSNIDKTARYLNYDNAIKSLLITNIVYKINNLKSFSAPIKSHMNESEFKIYYNDPGYISTVFNINTLNKDNEDYGSIKGAIYENFILSELVQKIELDNIAYYSFQDQNNNRYEVDFIIEDQNANLIPIEVKSATNSKTKSLNKILNDNEKIRNSIKLSPSNFDFFTNSKKYLIPLYAIGFFDYKLNRICLK